MTDAFDKAPKPAPKAKAAPIAGWSRKFIGNITSRFCTFNHPTAGRVAGYCIGAVFDDYSEPGHIPDFKLLIQGLSKTKRNQIEVNLVESRAQFYDTEQLAVNDI